MREQELRTGATQQAPFEAVATVYAATENTATLYNQLLGQAVAEIMSDFPSDPAEHDQLVDSLWSNPEQIKEVFGPLVQVGIPVEHIKKHIRRVTPMEFTF